ncbi:redox-sensing transcriptional repressor Rex [Thermobrachium celere]|nr:redox-sensing transcriptional repressor Rex [Thermobrachium celere]GFR34876.1 redox-sensing transcriptional repressor Rex [Thermobrachium celere]
MAKETKISMAVIRRLPKYHRYLGELLRKDIDRISSKELSERIGFTASQIRQDLNCFGDFGQQGYGYNVKDLYNQIGKILGLDKEYKTVIVGAGNIGQAVANYSKFERLGFHLQAIFDKNPKLIGIKIRDIEVKDVEYLDTYLKENPTDIGIICVPKEQAQSIADIMVRNGIKGIWNFAPTDLVVPDDVIVENVHLSESLMILSYRLNESNLFKE